MDNSSFISQSTSFFALKKCINLINLIAKYLNNNQKIEWNDILKSQKDLQQLINSAVLCYFPGEDLNSYKLLLPPKVKSNYQTDITNLVTPKITKNKDNKKLSNVTVNKNSSDDLIVLETKNVTQKDLPSIFTPVEIKDNMVNEDEPLFGSYVDYPHLYDNIKTTTTNNDNENLKSKEQSSNHSVSSLVSTEEGSTDNGFYREASIKEPVNVSQKEDKNNVSYYFNEQNEVKEPNLFNDEPEEQEDCDVTLFNQEEECTGLPDVLDHLTEARKKYMFLINSKGISSLDSSIPQHMISPKIAYLFKNNFPFSDKVEQLNRDVFGFKHFRGVQLAAINAIMLGHDCFVMMATGVGKSHCYQLPSLLLEGTVVVFSPLLSLVEDQIQSLTARGIEAQTLNGQSTAQEFKSVVKSLTEYSRGFDKGSILFITPEKFDRSKSVLSLLEKLHDMDRLKLFVIDEAHCVSQWGHSFRQDYRKLCNLKENFPTVPILAITATATSDVINDITSVLQFRNHVSLRTTINRPNLWIEVREKTKKYMDEIIEILNSTSGCGIIYCLTTSDCEKIAERIYKNGISVAVYHSKMELEDRVASQKLWKTGDIRIIVATVAFGMGIDKSDVRFILHTSAPTSILSYYQEIGRAGRDGKFSITILWYSTRDFERHKNINESISNRNTMFSSEMRDFCKNRTTCRRMMILEAFGEESHITSCLGCDNCCLKLATKVSDVTEEAIIITNFLQEAMGKRKKGYLTANILVDGLRGLKNKTVGKYRLDENHFHGSLKMYKPKYISDIILQMVKMKIIKEARRQSMSFGRTVLMVGPAAPNLLKGFLRVNITCYQELKPFKKSKSKGSDDDESIDGDVKKKNKSRKKKNADDDEDGSSKLKKKTSNKEGSKKSKGKSKESSSKKSKKQDKDLLVTASQTTFVVEPSGVIDLTHESEKTTSLDSEKIAKIFEKPLEMEYEYPNITNSLNSQSQPQENSDNLFKIEANIQNNIKEETNFELFCHNPNTQTQKEISVSDIITAEMNNIRRKIPGTLL